MFARFVALTLGMLIATGAFAPARTKHSHRRESAARSTPSLEMYSRRALRRARTILQLKLLELREERLDRARRVIEQQLPPEFLFPHGL